MNNSTNQKVEIDLKAILCDVAVEERDELISMLKRIPADELLELNNINLD